MFPTYHVNTFFVIFGRMLIVGQRYQAKHTFHEHAVAHKPPIAKGECTGLLEAMSIGAGRALTVLWRAAG